MEKLATSCPQESKQAVSVTEEVVFASKYVLGQRIGRGAMGNVYEAQVDDGSSDRVAIKILKSELISEEKTVRRFVQEGEIFSLIDHENVIRVLDVVADGEQLAIVMELVPDGDLRQMMNRSGVSPSMAVKLAADVAAGLEATHAANVVHRDLKPPNILMVDSDDGWVAKISDFGIARLLDDATTRSSTTIGTPLYMAPESVAKDGPESPADIYALGIIVFEMLIGKAPFHEGGTLGVIRAHADDLPPVLHGVPEELSALVQEMLRKDPATRPAADEVHNRLLQILPLVDNDQKPYHLPAIEESLFAADVLPENDPDEVAEADKWVAEWSEQGDDEEATGIYYPVESSGSLVGSNSSGLAARLVAARSRLRVSNINLIVGAASVVLLLALGATSLLNSASRDTTVAGPDTTATATAPAPASTSTVAPRAGQAATGEEPEGDPELPTFDQGQAPGSVRPAEDVSENDSSTETADAAPVTDIPRGTQPSPVVEAPVTTIGARTPITNSGLTTVVPVTTTPLTTQRQVTTAEATTTERSTTTEQVTTTERPTTTERATTTERPTTTRATTTTAAPSTTRAASSAPIRILTGPAVVSRGPTSIVFAYTTNEVCGTGSFTYTNNATGASAGGHVGDSGCFGPAHEGRSQWGNVSLEPGTSYTVRLTVRGQPSDGSLATGTGSISRTFQVTTSG